MPPHGVSRTLGGKSRSEVYDRVRKKIFQEST